MSHEAKHVSRRGFLGGAAGIAGLAACGAVVGLAGRAPAAQPAWQKLSDRKNPHRRRRRRLRRRFAWQQHPNCIVEAVSDLQADRRGA